MAYKMKLGVRHTNHQVERSRRVDDDILRQHSEEEDGVVVYVFVLIV